MNKGIILGGCVLVMAMALDARIASASHFSGLCADQLNSVEAAINAAAFSGRGNDQTNLQTKLDAAAAKIGLGKFSDAVDKLMDISDKATALATAVKPKLDDASAINSAVADAITCVGSL